MIDAVDAYDFEKVCKGRWKTETNHIMREVDRMLAHIQIQEQAIGQLKLERDEANQCAGDMLLRAGKAEADRLKLARAWSGYLTPGCGDCKHHDSICLTCQCPANDLAERITADDDKEER